MRVFLLFLPPTVKGIKLERYVIDLFMRYTEMSKLCDLIKNWISYAWLSEMALTMVICMAEGKSAISIN